METNFNLGSLKTIQNPLLDYLNNAHDNIVKNIEIIKDEKKIPTNHDYITIMDKLDKTFKMIGLHSLSVIFNLNKEALMKVSQVTYNTETHLEILNAVLVIVNNTKTYLKSLVNGAKDHPTRFFENYSIIANLIRKEVNIKDLFNPHLELKSNLQSNVSDELRRGVIINSKTRKNLLENLKVVENTFSNNLNFLFTNINDKGVFSSNEAKEAYQLMCKNIYEKFDVAQKLKISKSYYIMFGLLKFYICIISPSFNDDLLNFTLNNGDKIKEDLLSIKDMLLALLDDIRDFDDELKTGSLKVKDETIKNILFNILGYIKNTPSLMGMSVYRELNMYFDLDYYSDQLLDTKINVSEVLQINLILIEKLFADLKEDFTLLDTKKKATKEVLLQHIQRLININNKLAEATLPVKEVHIIISQFSATFSMIKSGKLKLTEMIERELSIALVLVEYGINNIIKNNVESRYKNEFGQQAQVQISRIKAAELDDKKELSMLPMPKLDAASQKLDEQKSLTKIFEQVSLDLVEMEEHLDNMIRNEGENVENLTKILKPLVEVKGILSILRKEEIIPALNRVLEVWSLVKSRGEEGWEVNEDMKESIVLISGLSLFVEAFKDENQDEAEELYENIVDRFNSKFSKNNIDVNNDANITNITSQFTVPEILEDKNIISVVDVEIRSEMKSKSFSLEEDISEDEYIDDGIILSKDDIVQEFKNFNGNDITRLSFLVKSYLSLSGCSDSIVHSGVLLSRALGNVALDNTPIKSINMSNFKNLIDIDGLLKILKTKNKVTNNTKQILRKYLNSLPGTVDNEISEDGNKVHSILERHILDMLKQKKSVKPVVESMELKNDLVVEKDNEHLDIDSAKPKLYTEKANDEELLEFFLEEVYEIIESLSSSISIVEMNYEDLDELTNIRRYFHTLKGSGRTVGLDYWGEAAWMTEQTLNRILSGDLPMTKELLSSIKYMKNFFEILVGNLKEKGEITVDLITVKGLLFPLNNKITHHIKIDWSEGELLKDNTEILVEAESPSVTELTMDTKFLIEEELPSVSELTMDTEFLVEKELPSVSELTMDTEFLVEKESPSVSELTMDTEFLLEEESPSVSELTMDTEFLLEEESPSVNELTMDTEFLLEEKSPSVTELKMDTEFLLEEKSPSVNELKMDTEFLLEEKSPSVNELTMDTEFLLEEESPSVSELTMDTEFLLEEKSPSVSELTMDTEFLVEEESPSVNELKMDTEFSVEEESPSVSELTMDNISMDLEQSGSTPVSEKELNKVLNNGLINGEVVDEDKQENIIIDGKEVSLYIFNLYKTESSTHIKKLKEFVHSNYNSDVEMDSNFMVHAHTLGSISKTVNLQKIASIASILEDISMMAIERDIVLSIDDMNVLRHSVDNIEIFQDFNIVADTSFYEKLIENLNVLYQKLTARGDDSFEENMSFNHENMMRNIESPDDALEKLKIESIEAKVDSDEIYEKLKLEAENLIEEKVNSMVSKKISLALNKLSEINESQTRVFSENVEKIIKIHNVEIEGYSQSVVELREKIEALEKINKQLIKHYDEAIRIIKIDVNNAKNATKSKSWLSKLFGGSK